MSALIWSLVDSCLIGNLTTSSFFIILFEVMMQWRNLKAVANTSTDLLDSNLLVTLLQSTHLGNIEIEKKYHYLKETFIQTIQSNTAPNYNEYSNGKINNSNKLKCTNADVPNFEDTN